jgi:serine/threonine protein kinase
VFLVRDNRDGKSYVMKEVDLSKVDAKGKADALKEAAFLEKMSHPNIIGYNEYFEGSTPPKGRLGKVNFLTNPFNHTNLTNPIRPTDPNR